MRTRDDCRRFAGLLDRMDAGGHAEPSAADLESMALHLESCAVCGVADDASQSVIEGVRDLEAELPGDEFFSSMAGQIMEAVRTEPGLGRESTVRGGLRRGSRASDFAHRSAGRRTPHPRRRRMVGGAAALAAGLALLVTSFLTGGRPSGQQREPFSGSTEVASVSVVDIDVDELISSDDAWLIASYDIFDLGMVDSTDQVEVEKMSDSELDALEGIFGAAPSLG